MHSIRIEFCTAQEFGYAQGWIAPSLMNRSSRKTMARRFDHIDLRVRNLAEVRPFYERLLPALGFTREVSIPGRLTYEAEDSDGVTEFFGVTESLSHVVNGCRVAFWVDSREEVDRLATLARHTEPGILQDRCMRTRSTMPSFLKTQAVIA